MNERFYKKVYENEKFRGFYSNFRFFFLRHACNEAFIQVSLFVYINIVYESEKNSSPISDVFFLRLACN